MKSSSRMPLFDLRKLNASLPVPSIPKSSIELLVLGAKDDFIVVNVTSISYLKRIITSSKCFHCGKISIFWMTNPTLGLSFVNFLH